jgi:hypothetical protein
LGLERVFAYVPGEEVGFKFGIDLEGLCGELFFEGVR